MAFLFISGENSVQWSLSATRSFHYLYAAIAAKRLFAGEHWATDALVPSE